jgi:outer membrane murein-binding lipoprotein Lpp
MTHIHHTITLRENRGYFTLQSDWLHKNLCEIYKEVADVNDCDGFEETLLSLVGTSLWNKMLQIEAQGVDLMKNTQLMQSEGVDKVGHAGEKQVYTKDADAIDEKMDVFSEEMQGKVDALSNDVQSKVDALSNDVQSKVDAISNDVQSKVDAISNDVHSLTNDVQSKVDAISNDVHSLTNDVQSKVDALSNDLQSKVDALSNDVQSMNGKVNGIEDELKDLKVMMTKMMDMMARE